MSFDDTQQHPVPCTCGLAAGDTTGKHRCPQYNEKCEAAVAISSSRVGREMTVEADEEAEYDYCAISQVESQASVTSSGLTLCQGILEGSGNEPTEATPATSAVADVSHGRTLLGTVWSKMMPGSVSKAAANSRSAASTTTSPRLTSEELLLHTMVQASAPGRGDGVFANHLFNAGGGFGDSLPLPPSGSPSPQDSPDGSSRSSASVSAEYCPGVEPVGMASDLRCTGIWADQPIRYLTLEELSGVLKQ
ncbi:hypothetical protein ACHAQA_002811 [Verticillium albo-atrum]